MRCLFRATTLTSLSVPHLTQIDAVSLSDNDEDDLEVVAELDLDQVLEVLHQFAPLPCRLTPQRSRHSAWQPC